MQKFFVAFLLLAAAASASAQTPEGAAGTSQTLDNVYACSANTDDSARLACYDSAVRQLQQAQQQGDLVAIDRTGAEALQRDSFGFNIPTLARLLPRLNTSDVEEIIRVESQIERIGQLANSRYRFTLANGQAWDQVEADTLHNLREGDTVFVRRAALGSYMMVENTGGAARRVRRHE